MSAPPTSDVDIDPEWAAESNLGWILGVNGVFHVIAIGFVAARIYTRVFLVKTFGIDDALVIAATACALGGGMVTYVIAAHYGLGRHRLIIPTEDYKLYMKMTFIQAIVSTIGSLLFLKLSIGCSLTRLSQQKWYTRIIWGFMTFVTIYTSVSWIEWFLVCKPLEGFWDKDTNPSCLPQETHKAFALFNTSCNIVTDIAFATLLVPIIWALQMAKKTRLYLVGILSLGYFAVLIGIVKTVCQNVFRGQFDQSHLQINIGIIAACAPTLRPLVSNVLHLSTNSASRYPSNNVYGPNRSGATRGTGILGVRSLNNNDWVQTESFNGDFELEDRLKRQHDGNQPQTNAAAEGSGFGSEEMIIPSKDNDGGIMRTTVVTAT